MSNFYKVVKGRLLQLHLLQLRKIYSTFLFFTWENKLLHTMTKWISVLERVSVTGFTYFVPYLYCVQKTNEKMKYLLSINLL